MVIFSTKDSWFKFYSWGGIIVGVCVLLGLNAYADYYFSARIAGRVTLIILSLVLLAFIGLVGASAQTWRDPTHALAVLCIGIAFLLDGFFIAGASTFGPMQTVDGRVSDCFGRKSNIETEESSFTVRLPRGWSDEDCMRYCSVANYNEDGIIDRDKMNVRIQFSLWDMQVYRWTLNNSKPPVTLGEPPPRWSLRTLLELLLGVMLMISSALIWRAGVRQGFRMVAWSG